MSSYGQNIGFDLGTLYFKENWRTALIYIMIIMLFIAFCFSLVPRKYFYRKYIFYENKVIEEPNENKVNISDLQKTNSDLSNTLSSKKTKSKTIFCGFQKIRKTKTSKI